MSRIERYIWFQGGAFLIAIALLPRNTTLFEKILYYSGTGAIFIALVPPEKK